MIAKDCASRILETVAIHEVLSPRGFALQAEILAPQPTGTRQGAFVSTPSISQRMVNR